MFAFCEGLACPWPALSGPARSSGSRSCQRRAQIDISSILLLRMELLKTSLSLGLLRIPLYFPRARNCPGSDIPPTGLTKVDPMRGESHLPATHMETFGSPEEIFCTPRNWIFRIFGPGLAGPRRPGCTQPLPLVPKTVSN